MFDSWARNFSPNFSSELWAWDVQLLHWHLHLGVSEAPPVEYLNMSTGDFLIFSQNSHVPCSSDSHCHHLFLRTRKLKVILEILSPPKTYLIYHQIIWIFISQVSLEPTCLSPFSPPPSSSNLLDPFSLNSSICTCSSPSLQCSPHKSS